MNAGRLHPIDATLAVSLRIGAQIVGPKAKVAKANQTRWALTLLTSMMVEMEKYYLRGEERIAGRKGNMIGLEACGVMDLLGAVAETMWPDQLQALAQEFEDRPPAALEGVRIDEGTFRFLQQAGPPPVDMGEWLENRVVGKSQVVTVDRPGGATEAYALMRQRTEGEELATLVGIRRAGDEAVEICTVRGTGFTERGDLKERVAGGSMIVGDTGPGGEALFEEMEDPERRQKAIEWNDEVGELAGKGTFAQILAVAQRMVEEKDVRLHGIPPRVPSWMIPPMRPTRAKLKRQVARSRMEAGENGIFRQWKLPAGPGELEKGTGTTPTSRGEGKSGERAACVTHGVRAHYKRQAYGPKRKKRKSIYITGYWRGMKRDEAKALEWILPQWDLEGLPAGVGRGAER